MKYARQFFSLITIAIVLTSGAGTDCSSYTIVDLFAGVGGLSYGLSTRPEFEVVLANEIDPDIAKAYELNHPKAKMLVCGIEQLTADQIRGSLNGRCVDMVVGGPPCQSYSTAGKREMDGRANLFKEYKRVLEILQPRVFVFENVKGLLSMDGGALFPKIEKEFQDLGYDLKYKLMDAADYGVPQHRERVILVGAKGRNGFNFPHPTHGEGAGRIPWVSLSEALGDLPRIKSGESSSEYALPPQNSYQVMMRKGSGRVLTEYKSPKSGPNMIAIMEMLREGQDKSDLPESIRPKGGFANTYGKLWWGRPSGTITRNFSTPSSARCIHPLDSRALTIREGARLQSFPDSYMFYGSDEKKRIEIGNAVPPLLAAALAGPLLEVLKESGTMSDK